MFSVCQLVGRQGRLAPNRRRRDAARHNRGSPMKKTLRIATASAAALAVASSMSIAPAFSAEMTSVGPGEGEVDIVAWAGYIERGETDKAYDWVTDFEKADRLQGQRQGRRHLRRDGDADERRRLRPGHRLGRRQPAPRRRQAPSSRSTSISSRTGRRSTRACRTARGTPSTASTTARPTSGARTC